MAFHVDEPHLRYRARMMDNSISEAIRLFGPDSDPASRPDGIVSIDETFTQGFIFGLASIGLFPGRDVEIATHNTKGSPILSLWQKDITVLAFDVSEIAAALVTAAEKLASGHSPDTGGWESSYLLNAKQGTLRVLVIYPSLVRKQIA
jgi:DNA-binding LacI/PurR family transcriptional regulator